MLGLQEKRQRGIIERQTPDVLRTIASNSNMSLSELQTTWPMGTPTSNIREIDLPEAIDNERAREQIEQEEDNARERPQIQIQS